MVNFSIHLPSIFVGIFIGYGVMSLLWIAVSFREAEWGAGWHMGYTSGIEEGIRRAKAEEGEQNE